MTAAEEREREERDLLRKEVEQLRALATRTFPLQLHRDNPPGTPRQIPWAVAELAYAAYTARYGHDQSLERLAERGGFGACEMDTLLPDWRERIPSQAEIERLRNEVAAMRALLVRAACYVGGSDEDNAGAWAVREDIDAFLAGTKKEGG